MTHIEQIAAWHTDKPGWTERWSARDWDFAECLAEVFDILAAPPPKSCDAPPEGWYCTRELGHDGSCATYPVEG